MKLILKEAIEKRYQEVEVRLGDRVEISEWDHITVKGTVSEVSETKIKVVHAEFVTGAYSRSVANYDEYDDQTEFSFNIWNLASIKVAKFEEGTPLALIHEATRQNYCGSEYIEMSPLFYNKYKEYIKDYGYFHNYYGYKIVVNPDAKGLYVYAEPNEETKAHNLNPRRSYSIKYYQRNELYMIDSFISAENQLDTTLKTKLSLVGVPNYVYKLYLEGQLIERGTAKKRYPICS
ncbi:hypothetical protein [Priestia aryabhattai]